eukprot:11494334-Ditylum_brightwellii.AAC.1
MSDKEGDSDVEDELYDSMEEEQEDSFSYANPNPTASHPTNTPSPLPTNQTPPTTPTTHAKEENIYDFMSDHPTPVDSFHTNLSRYVYY